MLVAELERIAPPGDVAVLLEPGDRTLRVRFVAGEDIPGSLDAGVIATWTLVIWIDDQEIYRIGATLEGEEMLITVLDVQTGQELGYPEDPDSGDEELEVELPLNLLEQLTGPFSWAAMSTIQTADGRVFGDNVPDAGNTFTQTPEPDQRASFPE